MLDIFCHPLEADIFVPIDVESSHFNLRLLVADWLWVVFLNDRIHKLVMQFAIASGRPRKHKIVVFETVLWLSDISVFTRILLFLDEVETWALWVRVEFAFFRPLAGIDF